MREADIGAEKARLAIDTQVCPWCGAGPFVLLAGHTQRRHGVTAVALKEMAGLRLTDPTCSAEYSLRESKNPLRLKHLDEVRPRRSQRYTFTDLGRRRQVLNGRRSVANLPVQSTEDLSRAGSLGAKAMKAHRQSDPDFDAQWRRRLSTAMKAREPRRKIPLTMHPEIRRRVASGETISSVARSLNVSRLTIARIAK